VYEVTRSTTHRWNQGTKAVPFSSVGRGTEQSDATDDTLCRRDGRLEVDYCNSVATTRLAVDGTLVVGARWVMEVRRVDGEHVYHWHCLVPTGLQSHADWQLYTLNTCLENREMSGNEFNSSHQAGYVWDKMSQRASFNGVRPPARHVAVQL